MEKYNIISSFGVKNELSPEIWDGFVMKSNIRNKLLEIANEFLESLDKEIFVDDIQLTGSFANYNWSEYSDFDLHILIDFNQFGDTKELYKQLLDAKKKLFNEKYDFKIKQREVEIYPQDVTEKHESTGVFSIMNNEWVIEPKKIKVNLNKDKLAKEIDKWSNKIENILEKKDKLDYKKYNDLIKKTDEELKKYRKHGLSDKGELSIENLVFKYLRRSKLIEKLYKSMINKKNKELSLEKFIQEQINLLGLFKESNFIKDLRTAFNNLVKEKYVANVNEYNENIEKIQRALEVLGYELSKFGIDGKFGDETRGALNKFQEDNSLPKTNFLDEPTFNKIIEKLKPKKIGDAELTKPKYVLPKSSENLTYLDLNTEEGFDGYVAICDRFIKSRNPSSPITGKMLADSAKKYFSYGYIPPELVCAQLVQEGGLSTNPNARPIKTNNPFNVGNVDSGKNKFFTSINAGIDAYYRLIVKNYLPKGRDAHDLLQKFTNTSGNRYASDPNYENKLKSIISKIA